MISFGHKMVGYAAAYKMLDKNAQYHKFIFKNPISIVVFYTALRTKKKRYLKKGIQLVICIY